jgi:endonuclease/exonuclease/phosphatase family metal-dependent hydrolase
MISTTSTVFSNCMKSEPSPSMTNIRIVTINTAKGDFAYSWRIPWLAHELAALDPDIVLLQEALRSIDGTLDTTRALATALDVHQAYVPARRKIRQIEDHRHDSWSGLGMLSRWPLAETTVVPLPASVDDGERLAQLAIIATGTHRLLIGNLHLTYLRGTKADRMRRLEMGTILAHPWFTGAQQWHASVIGGDLNTWLPALPLVIDDHPSLELLDTYELGDGQPPRQTSPAFRPPAEGQCIDYLLSVSRDAASHPAFSNARVVLDRADPAAPSASAFPSDHRGVVLDLQLLPGDVGTMTS